ncbi:MAG: DUF1848 family protein [Candidatus Thorarchaeota archaeon]
MLNQINHTFQIVKSEIISCSRRTDIPAFLMDWLLERIQEGFVDVYNPFNRKQVSRISLNPKDVKCWVWWSKNFNEWINKFEQNSSKFKIFKGHLFQFTINSNSELERNLKISLETRFNQLEWLIEKFGIKAVNFRYDPIIFYRKKDSDTIFNNLNQFEYIIKNVSNLGIEELTFSFATLYPKVRNRMCNRGFYPINITFKKKRGIIEKLIKICNKYGIVLNACCQPDLLDIKGIEQAHCIDAINIEKLIGEPIEKVPDKGQRQACGCYKSKDIGGYSGIFRCKHDCAYCYASPAKN